MYDVMEFATDDGATVRVDVAEDAAGSRPVSRGGGVGQAAHTFEQSLDGARAAAEAALRVFRDGRLQPDSVEIEFGVKLAAETGAVLVKGSAEGHLLVKLTWSPGRPAGTGDGPPPGTGGDGGGAPEPEAHTHGGRSAGAVAGS